MNQPTVTSFILPKQGEQNEDCQDSLFPEKGQPCNGSCAVADGTTTSFFSRSWARILTQRFGEDSDLAFSDWRTWLEQAQEEWQSEMKARIASPQVSDFTRNDFNAKKPAAATFVGLQFGPDGRQVQWRVLVIGDSCLFHIRADGSAHSYRLQRAEEFSFVTESVESYPDTDADPPFLYDTRDAKRAAPAREGEMLLLATDALAKWLLTCAESGTPVWGSIAALRDAKDFASLVQSARRDTRCALVNDDMALVTVCLGAPAKAIQQQHYVPSLPVAPPTISPSAPSHAPGSLPPASSPVAATSAAHHSQHRPATWNWLVVVALAVGLAVLVFLIVKQYRDNQAAAEGQRDKAEQLAKEREAQAAQMGQSLQRADGDLARMRDEIAELRNQKSKMEGDLTARTGNAKAKDGEIAQLKKEVDKLTEQSNELRRDLAVAQARTKDERGKPVKGSDAEKIAQLTKEKEDLAKRIAELTSELEKNNIKIPVSSAGPDKPASDQPKGDKGPQSPPPDKKNETPPKSDAPPSQGGPQPTPSEPAQPPSAPKAKVNLRG